MKYCPYCGAALMGSAVSFCSECGKKLLKKSRPQKKRRLKPEKKSSSDHSSELHLTAKDKNYDGYYDDVKPEDEAVFKDQTDPELIKRIALIIAGAILIIIVSVIFIQLL